MMEGKILEPVPEEWSIANDEDSASTTKAKNASYEVTLIQRQNADSTTEDAYKVKTTT